MPTPGLERKPLEVLVRPSFGTVLSRLLKAHLGHVLHLELPLITAKLSSSLSTARVARARVHLSSVKHPRHRAMPR